MLLNLTGKQVLVRQDVIEPIKGLADKIFSLYDFRSLPKPTDIIARVDQFVELVLAYQTEVSFDGVIIDCPPLFAFQLESSLQLEDFSVFYLVRISGAAEKIDLYECE